VIYISSGDAAWLSAAIHLKIIREGGGTMTPEHIEIEATLTNSIQNHLTLANLPDQFKGFLFDMDGTLLDSMVMWRRLMPDYLHEKGIVLPLDQVRKMQGYTLEQVIYEVAALYSDKLKAEEMFADYDAKLREAYGKQVVFKPHALEYLQYLKERDRQLALVTTTDRVYVDVFFQRFNLYDYFDVILTITDVGAGKNKPEIYHEAASRMNLRVEECVIFEDALFALNTARKAGYTTVGVEDNGHVEEAVLAANCDLMITSWDWR
jgi:HAD superfamily hydrolase (TIGR01509 family)